MTVLADLATGVALVMAALAAYGVVCFVVLFVVGFRPESRESPVLEVGLAVLEDLTLLATAPFMIAVVAIPVTGPGTWLGKRLRSLRAAVRLRPS